MSALSMIMTATVIAGSGERALPLEVESHAARFDTERGEVHYEIVFSRSPDLLAIDERGVPADSFQVYLDTMPGCAGWGGTSPYPWEAVIRGDEVHVEGRLRIRDHVLGPSAEPLSGGWGPLAGSVAYTLRGNRLTFTAPFSMQNTASGRFDYEVEVYQAGAWTRVPCRGSSEPVR